MEQFALKVARHGHIASRVGKVVELQPLSLADVKATVTAKSQVAIDDAVLPIILEQSAGRMRLVRRRDRQPRSLGRCQPLGAHHARARRTSRALHRIQRQEPGPPRPTLGGDAALPTSGFAETHSVALGQHRHAGRAHSPSPSWWHGRRASTPRTGHQACQLLQTAGMIQPAPQPPASRAPTRYPSRPAAGNRRHRVGKRHALRTWKQTSKKRAGGNHGGDQPPAAHRRAARTALDRAARARTTLTGSMSPAGVLGDAGADLRPLKKAIVKLLLGLACRGARPGQGSARSASAGLPSTCWWAAPGRFPPEVPHAGSRRAHPRAFGGQGRPRPRLRGACMTERPATGVLVRCSCRGARAA